MAHVATALQLVLRANTAVLDDRQHARPLPPEGLQRQEKPFRDRASPPHPLRLSRSPHPGDPGRRLHSGRHGTQPAASQPPAPTSHIAQLTLVGSPGITAPREPLTCHPLPGTRPLLPGHGCVSGAAAATAPGRDSGTRVTQTHRPQPVRHLRASPVGTPRRGHAWSPPGEAPAATGGTRCCWPGQVPEPHAGVLLLPICTLRLTSNNLPRVCCQLPKLVCFQALILGQSPAGGSQGEASKSGNSPEGKQTSVPLLHAHLSLFFPALFPSC